MTKAQTPKAPTVSTTPPAKVGKKKQKSSRPQATKRSILVAREEPLGVKMYQRDKDLLDIILKELKDTKEERIPHAEASSIQARVLHTSPSRTKPLKAKVGEPVSSIG
ncbi:hypothetical protein ACFX1W_006830 [Malus domestica]